jgi:hypothetical protein
MIRVFVEDDATAEEKLGEHGSAEGFSDGIAQMNSMLLLVKTQLLICRRYEKQISRYKYPAYRVLLGCVELPPSCREACEQSDLVGLLGTSLVKQIRADFVRSAVELLFRTCLVSPLNSEELVEESGVTVLVDLLGFYMKVLIAFSKVTRDDLGDDLASDEVILGIIGHVVHTLAGIAFFESGRNAIKAIENPSRFLHNWRRCIDGRLLEGLGGKFSNTPIKRFALEGIANMAKDKFLQEHLVGCGIVWPLVRLVLRYDPTLEQGQTAEDDPDDTGMSVVSSNTQARLAVRALGILSGAVKDAPRNEALMEGLIRLLTRPIALMLRNKRTDEILRILNANVEKADIIWNVRMREQLEALLVKVEQERPDYVIRTANEELMPIGDFCYEALKGELSIGGVYVRVFNKEGKGALSCVPDPPMFARAVIEFVARSMNRSELGGGCMKIPVKDESSPSSVEDTKVEPVELKHPAFLLSICALRILTRVDGLVDDLLAEKSSIVPWVLLSLLELPLEAEVSRLTALAHPAYVRLVLTLSSLSFFRHLRLAVIFLASLVPGSHLGTRWPRKVRCGVFCQFSRDRSRQRRQSLQSKCRRLRRERCKVGLFLRHFPLHLRLLPSWCRPVDG